MREADFAWLARIHYTHTTGDQTPEIVIPKDTLTRLLGDGLVERHLPRSNRADGMPVVATTRRGRNHVTRTRTPAARGAW